MQRKRNGLVPIGEFVGELDGTLDLLLQVGPLTALT